MRRWGEKGTIAILTAIQHQIARFYLLLCISVPSINCTNSFYFCCDDGGGSGMIMKMRERVGALSVIAISPGNCSVLLFSAAVSHFNLESSTFIYVSPFVSDVDILFIHKHGDHIFTRSGNRLNSQLPSECNYFQSTGVYGDYQLIIAINSSIP